MNIVIISDWFSDNMGYAENYLPVALSKQAVHVHVITSDLQIYATHTELYKKIYESYLGSAIVPIGKKELNGFTLHRLLSYRTKYGIGICGLEEKLKELKPDIVYLFEINTETTLQVVKLKPSLNFKIFTESRLHLSIYRPPHTIKKRIRHYFEKLKWEKVGKSFQKIYPIAPDVLFVITKYFGQNKNKCELSSLAVDINNFKPIISEEERFRREEIRKKNGFKEQDIICIYTGRFNNEKGTLLLAQAINYLHQKGKINFKGLFVGAGAEEYEKDIQRNKGCIIHPFIQSTELVKYYQAADIGVWPKQESTSQLDAIACGLPIIISSKVEDLERIRGNGLSYIHEDFVDLASKILSLENKTKRMQLGDIGSRKIRQFYSWDHIAALRLKDFEVALS